MKLISDIEVTGPIVFAAQRLEKYEGTVVLRYDPGCEEQSYIREVLADSVRITAEDDAGFMYGLLDIAEACGMGESLTDHRAVPYIKNRGIKFNIPLDARTPSYSDASTSAAKNIPQMWEMSFWEEFLDRMALEKYNVLSLWSLSPFPSLVRVPEFPNASIEDVKVTTKPFAAKLSGKEIYGEDHRKSLYTVKRMTVEEKIDFWRRVMQYAAERCVRVYLFTWNLFVYGTEDSGYGFTENQNDPATRSYVYCGTRALMDTYPLLAGIGVTAGENMTFNGKSTDAAAGFSETDVGFIAETYGKAIADYLAEHPERDFTLIHRMQMARYDDIMGAYKDFPGNFEISFKYSQAHMYSSTKPMFITGFLKEKAPDIKIWLTVRNDDYYMYRWGNPQFAREYLSNMPIECMSGFYMGPDGFTWGRDYMTRDDETHPLFVDKMWYMFKIWGQLSYDLSLEERYFKGVLRTRFGLTEEKAEQLYECWKEASQIIPEFNCTHWHDFDFQWYPEGCCMYDTTGVSSRLCFADINEFVSCSAMPGSGFASVGEYADAAVNGTALKGISPGVTADSIYAHARRTGKLLEELKDVGTGIEYERTLYDLEAMSLLGMYYSLKERAAMELAVSRSVKNPEGKKRAADLLREAALYWKRYSAMTVNAYIPQVLTRLCGKVNVQEFDELADLDVLLAME